MILKHKERVDFNPDNRSHRDAVITFLKTRSWAKSSFRFSHDPTYGSIAHQVQAKLLDWFIHNMPEGEQ